MIANDNKFISDSIQHLFVEDMVNNIFRENRLTLYLKWPSVAKKEKNVSVITILIYIIYNTSILCRRKQKVLMIFVWFSKSLH